MQKLLGRIRKQQEEWSKQNVDRKSNILSEETKEEQEITGKFSLFLICTQLTLISSVILRPN